MRKKSLALTLDEFDESLAFYVQFAEKVACAQRVIRYAEEKKELLEAFVLRIVSLWEVFAEDMLVACLNRDSTRYAEYADLRLRKHLSEDEARAMLTGLGYLDLRSVGDLQAKAKQLLVIDPLASIPRPAARKIDELIVMRNYLAHYSGRAKRALRAVYENTYHMQSFRQPGGFLWANVRPGGKMRFFVYLDALRDAAAAMRQAVGHLAR